MVSWFRVIIIFGFSILFAFSKSALAGVESANICRSLFAETQQFSVNVSINIADLKKLKLIGNGTEASVFKTTFNRKIAAFRYIDSMNPESESYLLSQLTAEQRSSLASIDVGTAYRIASLSLASDDPPAFDLIQNQIARMIVTSVETRKMQGLLYRGNAIAPEIYGVVRNKDGIIVGQIQEYIPGKNLIDLLDSLTRKQKREILNQVIDQMKILSAHGAFHGDLDIDTNIMVSGFPSGPLTARLIDFDQYRLGHRDPREAAEKEINLLTSVRDSRGL